MINENISKIINNKQLTQYAERLNWTYEKCEKIESTDLSSLSEEMMVELNNAFEDVITKEKEEKIEKNKEDWFRMIYGDEYIINSEEYIAYEEAQKYIINSDEYISVEDAEKYTIYNEEYNSIVDAKECTINNSEYIYAQDLER